MVLGVDLPARKDSTKCMIRVVPCLVVLCWMVTGCAWFGGKKSPGSATTQAQPPALTGINQTNGAKVTVTPDSGSTGNVARVNPAAKFAVLNFPFGNLPLVGQRLYVYRQGLRVGEVRVTGPTDNDNTVADIVNGEAQKGDEIRVR